MSIRQKGYKFYCMLSFFGVIGYDRRRNFQIEYLLFLKQEREVDKNVVQEE